MELGVNSVAGSGDKAGYVLSPVFCNLRVTRIWSRKGAGCPSWFGILGAVDIRGVWGGVISCWNFVFL